MTKEELKAFGGTERFRPFVLVFKSGLRVEVTSPNQMVFAPHPDEAIIYYQGSWRVLALSRIDHLELIPLLRGYAGCWAIGRTNNSWPRSQFR
jgi:hypothetical protein